MCHFKQLQTIKQHFISTNRQTGVLNKHSETISIRVCAVFVTCWGELKVDCQSDKLLLTKNRQFCQYPERPEEKQTNIMLLLWSHFVCDFYLKTYIRISILNKYSIKYAAGLIFKL